MKTQFKLTPSQNTFLSYAHDLIGFSPELYPEFTITDRFLFVLQKSISQYSSLTISEITGISYGSILTWAHQHGLKLHGYTAKDIQRITKFNRSGPAHKKHRMIYAQRNKIYRMYIEGASLGEVIKAFHIKVDMIRRILKFGLSSGELSILCMGCGGSFVPRKFFIQKFCKPYCRIRFTSFQKHPHRLLSFSSIGSKSVCQSPVCHKFFVVKGAGQRYCSRQCLNKAKNLRFRGSKIEPNARRTESHPAGAL